MTTCWACAGESAYFDKRGSYVIQCPLSGGELMAASEAQSRPICAEIKAQWRRDRQKIRRALRLQPESSE